MAELDVKPEWVGKNLLELNLRRKYSLNIVAINNNGNFTTMINPEQPLEKTMKLIVLAEPAKMRKLN
jgi:trk system potassium uptake protein TrkA